MSQETRPPNFFEVHIGQRVRARRREIGLSMDALGAHLGVTYQQVQKYENGANRISASKLYEIARALETTVAHFYEGLPNSGEDERSARIAAQVDALLAQPYGQELLDAVLVMPGRLRRPFLAVAQGLVPDGPRAAENENLRDLPTWRRA